MRYEASIYEMGKSGVAANVERRRKWNLQVALWDMGIAGALQTAAAIGKRRKEEKAALEAAKKGNITQPDNE